MFLHFVVKPILAKSWGGQRYEMCYHTYVIMAEVCMCATTGVPHYPGLQHMVDKLQSWIWHSNWGRLVNTLRPRENGRHFPDILKCIFLNEKVWISIKISLKFVPRGPINNVPTLVQIMAWRRPGDKPLSEPRMVRLPTHICFTRPQWVEEDCVVNECCVQMIKN